MKKVYNLLRHFALCVGILGMAMLPSQLDAQCSISTVTATATLCSGANSNSYNVSGQVSFANAPGTGSLVISVQGGHSAVINAPFTSPVSYNIQKLIADGVNRTVTAYFTATPSCTGNTSVTVPSPVGTGFTTLPLNSYASTFYWGTMPYPQESWDGGYVPEYGGPFSFGGGIHDLDLQPQGITNMAAFCAELAEGVAGTTTYTGTYQYIPLENVSRGRATEALTESVHIPAGGIGRVRAGMLRWLFDQYYTSTNAATWTNSNAAAFQLAVWEIIQEVYSSNNSFTITSASPNGFYILATYNLTSRNLAESHLQALNALNWTDAQWMSYQSVNWHVIAIEHNQDPAPGGGDSQDLVLAQPLVCVVSCTTPTAFAAATQPTCSGGVAQSNGTITISGFTAGQRYQYSSGATFNSGAATPASITPIPMSGVITSTLPNTTQQYTVRIYDAADDACFVDRVVSMTAVNFTTSSTVPACHANGTPENASDDYMTFSINVANSKQGALTYTVTATQGGNPIAVTLANGSPATAVNCNLNTPLRTPAGSAGDGPIVLTITDNVHGCTTTMNIADPGTCATTCVPGTPSMVMYTYATQVQVTELVDVPIILPQFNDQGGTRTLTSVTLEYGSGGYFSALMESNSAVPVAMVRVTSTTDSEIELNGNILSTFALSATSGFQSLPVGISVPPQGTWPGDDIVNNSTIEAMRPWAQGLMSNLKDPRLDPRWVTTATGNNAHDDDIYFLAPTLDEKMGTVTYTNPVDLVPFQGTGNVPLEVTTLSGFSTTGGGGFISAFQATRGYAFGKVTYTYECAAPPACVFTTSSTVPACHANGTPENASDDYMTFSINVVNSLQGSTTYTVTATQNGNPIAVTLANGSPATAVNCNLDTPLRTPAGSAGDGPIVLTITDNVHSCITTMNIVDPGTCAVTCVPGTPSMVMYNYRTQFDITELTNLPLIIPQFDQQGGTRTLTSVKLDYEVGFTTNAILENSAANPQNFEADFTCRSRIRLDGTNIVTENMLVSLPLTTFPAGIEVPAQGTWPGDDMSGSVPSTINAMPWVFDYFTYFKNPLADPRWVTTATGDPTDDDDMLYFPPMSGTGTGSVTYNLPGDLIHFIGSGNVPLVTSTLTGQTSSGGGGNILIAQRTRAYADVKVTYTYECAVQPCVMGTLTAVPGACDPNTNTYNLTGQLTFSNPPTTGELTIRVPGHASVKYLPPFTSPINYSIGPLNSDMGNYNVVATFSDEPSCNISTAFNAPAMCLAIAPACAANETQGFEIHTDAKALSTTDYNHTFTNIPKFDDMGGTRTLKKVLVSIQQTVKTAGVVESLDAAPATIAISTTGNSTLKLDGNTINTAAYNFTGANKMVSAVVDVPAQGTWPGDAIGSTVAAMGGIVISNLNADTDPTIDPGWVTNQTGNPGHDDDIAYFPPHFDDLTNNIILTAPGDIASFTGAGPVDLTFMVMATSSANGAGNLFSLIQTRAAAAVYVKYIYCERVCTTPTATAAATQPTCVGAGAPDNGTITISGFTNERYQYSAGATFNSGAAIPALITAIPVSGVITSTLPNTTQQYTVRIYDAADDACFVDRVVTITSVVCCSVTINSSTPSACVPATNTYSLTVNVSWVNASGTTLTVSSNAPGATPQTITTTLGSSGTQSVTLTGLTSNATMYNVTAQFGAGCTATTTNAFTAPPACTGCGAPACGSTTYLKKT